MKYLSFDLEATGLESHDLIIEFAAVPIDSEKKEILESSSFHCDVKCPSFEVLKPNLSDWVIQNNEELINRAHKNGLELSAFKESFEQYLLSKEIKNFFKNEPIVLFGKSINAIDLPFMNRDLGWEWMRKHFSHRTLDFSCVCYSFMDKGILPPGMESGSKIMDFLGMGEVAHTALADAINTAKMYFKVLELE